MLKNSVLPLAAIIVVVLNATACTCFIPSTGGVAWRTNHRLVQSFDQLEEPRECKVVCTVTQYKRWERKPFTIANTADCAREVKLTASLDAPLPSDPDREVLVITYRKQVPIGIAEPSVTLEDLSPGDKVDIAYNLDDDSEPIDIVVMMNRQTDEANRERRRVKSEAEWRKIGQRALPTNQD